MRVAFTPVYRPVIACQPQFGSWFSKADKADILPIVKYPAPVLKEVAKPVTEWGDNLKKLVRQMKATMKAAGGIGLAAPQVGVPLRVAVMKIWGAESVLVNPVITKQSGSKTTVEGCLSIPFYMKAVTRARKVSVDAQDETGKAVHYDFSGLAATCAQHEIDHLNGITLKDK